MREQRTRECAGCSAPVPCKDEQRRSWCERCQPIAGDFYAIERTGRLLERYGLSSAAAAVAAATESIHEQLRTGDGPASSIAVDEAARVEQRRADREAYYEARDAGVWNDEPVETKLATDERSGILIYLADRIRPDPPGPAS